ncbi:hypothetical protein [Pseudomonas serbica]|jgi:hypothetical protein|uniref:hypothetical protein n=1 Tax=Pseudomonas serbica TaxID=2965074 RepID=UPI00237B3774|nr:hypothetical protein [Pseudomonas serbica]
MATTTLEQDAAVLFQRALQENHLGLVTALKMTVPAGDLADALKREIKPDQEISPAWMDALTRPTYDLLDARKLTNADLMSNPAYAQFITSLFESTKDRDSQHALLHGLTAASQHGLALQMFTQMADPSSFASYFKTYIAKVAAQYPAYFFSETGTTNNLTPASLELLDKLDLDVPAHFTAKNYPDSNRSGDQVWNASRFSMNISRVGAVANEHKLEVPTAKRVGGGPLVINNAALANAYMTEYARIDAGLGAWHQENFPRYLPVLADASSRDELVARGGVRIKPNITDEYQYGLGTEETKTWTNPSHGFSPINPGDDLDKNQILLAMSLLSLQQIGDLIKTNNQQIVLVPAEQLQALAIEPTAPPEALKVAMRYHRPELLITDLYNVSKDCFTQIPTSLYLRGIEVKYAQNQSLYIYSGLSEDPDYPSCFVSEAEIEGMFKNFTRRGVVDPDAEKLMICEKPHLTLAENVTIAHAVLQGVTDQIGCKPGVSFRGSPEFMRALAGSRIPTTEPGGMTDINGNNQAWYTSNEGKRVGACLGSVGYDYGLLKLSISELLTKGCRMKESASEDAKTAKQRILGLLDRHSLEDIVANMKTDAQFKFVNENFDLMPLVQTLPKKFSLTVAKDNFTKDLGL